MDLLTESSEHLRPYEWKPSSRFIQELLNTSVFAEKRIIITQFEIDNHVPAILSNENNIIYPLKIILDFAQRHDVTIRRSSSINIGLPDILSFYFKIDSSYISYSNLTGQEIILGYNNWKGGLYANATLFFGDSEDLGFIVFVIKQFKYGNISYYVIKPLFTIIPALTIDWSSIRVGHAEGDEILPIDTGYGTIQYSYFNYSYPLNYSSSWPPVNQLSVADIPVCYLFQSDRYIHVLRVEFD